MGESTEFEGKFWVTPPLAENHRKYLDAFSEVRHNKRTKAIELIPDPIREAVGLPVGPEGAYVVSPKADKKELILNDHFPAQGQPSLWCYWVPDETGCSIVDNDQEKFYEYVEWLKYLIDHFLAPWGYVLNGEMRYWGEYGIDKGIIKVVKNKVSVQKLS